jgi:hypothetical protein
MGFTLIILISFSISVIKHEGRAEPVTNYKQSVRKISEKIFFFAD